MVRKLQLLIRSINLIEITGFRRDIDIYINLKHELGVQVWLYCTFLLTLTSPDFPVQAYIDNSYIVP